MTALGVGMRFTAPGWTIRSSSCAGSHLDIEQFLAYGRRFGRIKPSSRAPDATSASIRN